MTILKHHQAPLLLRTIEKLRKQHAAAKKQLAKGDMRAVQTLCDLKAKGKQCLTLLQDYQNQYPHNQYRPYIFSAETVLHNLLCNPQGFSKINEKQESVPWKKQRSKENKEWQSRKKSKEHSQNSSKMLSNSNSKASLSYNSKQTAKSILKASKVSKENSIRFSSQRKANSTQKSPLKSASKTLFPPQPLKSPSKMTPTQSLFTVKITAEQYNQILRIQQQLRK